MKIIRNLRDIRSLDESPARRSMLRMAALCHRGDPAAMDYDFDSVFGGEWYLIEPGDVPQNLTLDYGDTMDLFTDQWNWCDVAALEDGCFIVFWGINNAGGPCLYAPDEEWLSAEFRTWLLERVAESKALEGVEE